MPTIPTSAVIPFERSSPAQSGTAADRPSTTHFAMAFATMAEQAKREAAEKAPPK